MITRKRKGLIYYKLNPLTAGKSLWLLPVFICLTACRYTYYVVRHAEKESAAPGMQSDVSLSEAGMQRAEDLKQWLYGKKIVYVYSTDTKRTRSTARPAADYFHRLIQVAPSFPDSAWIKKLKSLRRNTLIVGHSNTVDDIVNGLAGRNLVPGNLADNEYDNIFILSFRGRKMFFEKKRYGNPSGF